MSVFLGGFEIKKKNKDGFELQFLNKSIGGDEFIIYSSARKMCAVMFFYHIINVGFLQQIV